MIDHYLNRGEMLVLEYNGVKAVCVVTDEGDGICEAQKYCRKTGCSTERLWQNLIKYLITHYAGKYCQMIV